MSNSGEQSGTPSDGGTGAGAEGPFAPSRWAERLSHVREFTAEAGGLGLFLETTLAPAISHREVVVCFSDVRGFTRYCNNVQRRGLDAKIQNFLASYFPIYFQGLYSEYVLRHELLEDVMKGQMAKGAVDRDQLARHAEVDRLLVPSAWKMMGDGIMIVWELDGINDPSVQGMATRRILRAVDTMRVLFNHNFRALSPAELDSYSKDVLDLKLGFGLAKGHVLRLDFPGRPYPDYVGTVVNLACRLLNVARPEGVVAHVDFSPSLLEGFVNSGEGRFVTLKDTKGLATEKIEVFASKEVLLSEGAAMPGGRSP